MPPRREVSEAEQARKRRIRGYKKNPAKSHLHVSERTEGELSWEYKTLGHMESSHPFSAPSWPPRTSGESLVVAQNEDSVPPRKPWKRRGTAAEGEWGPAWIPVPSLCCGTKAYASEGKQQTHHPTAVADCGKETIKPAIVSGLEQEKALGPDKQTYPPLGWGQTHQESPTPESQGPACLRPRLNQDYCGPCAPPSKPVWSPHWLLHLLSYSHGICSLWLAWNGYFIYKRSALRNGTSYIYTLLSTVTWQFQQSLPPKSRIAYTFNWCFREFLKVLI